MFVVLKGGSALSNKLINNENNNIFDNIKELVINSRNKVYNTVNKKLKSIYNNMLYYEIDKRVSNYGEIENMLAIQHSFL